MYPLIRMSYQLFKHRNDPALTMDGEHVSNHLCLLSDIDPWRELNNGRTLTLYDLGRLPYFRRIPLLKAVQDNKWRLTVAGATIRYRRRVTLFSKIETRTRAIGRDARFFYLQQTMYVKGQASSSAVYRLAIADNFGIVPMAKVVNAIGQPEWHPELPAWVQTWSASESERPWPPETELP